MRIKPQFVLPLGNQTVMSFAEINGLCGDNNLDALTGDNHEATELGRRSALISPIRSAELSSGGRTNTPATSISICFGKGTDVAAMGTYVSSTI